jgi:YbgC/YbaW family acyl-CoA thioester hydrolase
MFVRQTHICLKDTDATGVIYFSELLKLALETFEDFLRPTCFSLKSLLSSKYLLPVVHAESDYISPLCVDDAVGITMYLDKVGTSSLTLGFDFYNKTSGLLAGTAKITHVVTLKDERRSTPIPPELHDILQSLQSKAMIS